LFVRVFVKSLCYVPLALPLASLHLPAIVDSAAPVHVSTAFQMLYGPLGTSPGLDSVQSHTSSILK
jgi:hypothetical protein